MGMILNNLCHPCILSTILVIATLPTCMLNCKGKRCMLMLIKCEGAAKRPRPIDISEVSGSSAKWPSPGYRPKNVPTTLP